MNKKEINKIKKKIKKIKQSGTKDSIQLRLLGGKLTEIYNLTNYND